MIDILEGGIGFLWLLERPPLQGGDFRKCKVQRTQMWPVFGWELKVFRLKPGPAFSATEKKENTKNTPEFL